MRKPYSVPQTAALPDFRVREVPAFSKIGVDFCGPVYIKATAERTNKAYIVLFSCCVTRAIYLELVGDMSAEALTRAPRRFTARRGTHTLIAHSWNSRRDWVCPPKTIPESNAKMLILFVLRVEALALWDRFSLTRWRTNCFHSPDSGLGPVPIALGTFSTLFRVWSTILHFQHS